MASLIIGMRMRLAINPGIIISLPGNFAQFYGKVVCKSVFAEKAFPLVASRLMIPTSFHYLPATGKFRKCMRLPLLPGLFFSKRTAAFLVME